MIDGSENVFPLVAKRVLVLCPHTDDEWGCAGALLRLIRTGAEVKYIAFSSCEESVPEGFPADVLVGECRACTEALGIRPENVEILGLPVRRFPEHRQEILQKLVDVRREYSPDLVFLPSSSDTHQDHATLFAEGFRAFKQTTMLGYEMPQNVTSFENSAFVALDQDLIEKKADAVLLYGSQKHRQCATRDFITSLAKVRGVQCNAEYAESFEVIRLVLR